MRRSIISLVVGVVFALAALWMLYSMRPPAQKEPAGAPAMETTAVLVAKKDIAYGERIVPTLVQVISWPTAYLPKDVIVNQADLFEGPEAPRIALRPFTAGEPFLKEKVSGFGERPILSRKVAEGMRAFTVRINDVSGVAGFILPGDHVDIFLTRPVENGGPNGMATDVLLQNVAVLGIDQMSSEEQNNPVLGKSATFEVTPEDAQKLALASQVGTLSLSLRNYETLQKEDTKRIAANDLGEKKPEPVKAASKPAPPRDDSVYVRVRKGTQVSSEKVSQ